MNKKMKIVLMLIAILVIVSFPCKNTFAKESYNNSNEEIVKSILDQI